MKTRNLSVRKDRDYKHLLKQQKEIQDRIAYYERLGKSSPDEIIKEGASIIANAMNQVPETFVRKAVALAMKIAIPKSPRGRKPAHQGG